MARARQRSWRWPWERFRPPSETRDERDVNRLVLVSGAIAGLGVLEPEPDDAATSSREVEPVVRMRWTRCSAS